MDSVIVELRRANGVEIFYFTGKVVEELRSIDVGAAYIDVIDAIADCIGRSMVAHAAEELAPVVARELGA